MFAIEQSIIWWEMRGVKVRSAGLSTILIKQEIWPTELEKLCTSALYPLNVSITFEQPSKNFSW